MKQLSQQRRLFKGLSFCSQAPVGGYARLRLVILSAAKIATATNGNTQKRSMHVGVSVHICLRKPAFVAAIVPDNPIGTRSWSYMQAQRNSAVAES